MSEARMEDETYLVETEVAELLRLSPLTLTRWRYEKTGPPYYKPGGRILYSKSEVLSWLEATRGDVA